MSFIEGCPLFRGSTVLCSGTYILRTIMLRHLHTAYYYAKAPIRRVHCVLCYGTLVTTVCVLW